MSSQTIKIPTIQETNLKLGQQKLYRGKVRDVYTFEDYLLMIASDRISAFDIVLPKPIPYKGQVLNQIAAKTLALTADIVPNWLLSSPHPNVSFGVKCNPFKVEMVIRGYLVGSSFRKYKEGARVICGVPIPDGMKENEAFSSPIITPTTKADEGHDLDISKEEIISSGLVSREDYLILEKYTYDLFKFGSEEANRHGLILVDTKYEFGKDNNGKILLIDEIHTPDSSRFFYLEGYEERQQKGEKQKQLSKEFVREWLMEQGFMGEPGQEVPQMSDTFIETVTARYIELFEKMTGETFEPCPAPDLFEDIRVKALTILAKFEVE